MKRSLFIKSTLLGILGFGVWKYVECKIPRIIYHGYIVPIKNRMHLLPENNKDFDLSFKRDSTAIRPNSISIHAGNLKIGWLSARSEDVIALMLDQGYDLKGRLASKRKLQYPLWLNDQNKFNGYYIEILDYTYFG